MSNLDFGLTRDREAARAMLDYLNPLPRSVVRGDAYALLDGEWRFDIALEDRGLHEMWYAGHAYSGTALWPGSIEDHLLVAQTDQQRTRPWLDSVVAWYERDFIVPDHWSGTSDGLT
ncbi:MAG TPA: hypothetical protein VEZ12_24335, partial [Herpetosiphonaceae bacterium]|nr:hypothetical protein [Herpetosiphonaceae bacterium]